MSLGTKACHWAQSRICPIICYPCKLFQ